MRHELVRLSEASTRHSHAAFRPLPAPARARHTLLWSLQNRSCWSVATARLPPAHPLLTTAITPHPEQVPGRAGPPRRRQGVPAQARACAGRRGLAGQPRALCHVCWRIRGAVPRVPAGAAAGADLQEVPPAEIVQLHLTPAHAAPHLHVSLACTLHGLHAEGAPVMSTCKRERGRRRSRPAPP